MKLSTRQLVFLKHEMKEVAKDETRCFDEQSQASSVVDEIKEELEWQEQKQIASVSKSGI